MSKIRKPKERAGARPVGIKDIADVLGTSIGTVDRALHNKAGISAATRKRVLQTAKTLGYRPNLAARYLVSRKQLTVGVCLPREVAYFYDEVREGILEAASFFESVGLRILHRPYQVFGQHEVEAVQDMLKENVRGLIISPGYPNRLRPYIETATKKGVPVVCVASDAPGSGRLTSISVNPFTAGSMAGELIGQFIPRDGKVVIFIGMHATVDHQEKVNGFRRRFEEFCPHGEIVSVIETHDEAAEAFKKCQRVIKAHRVNGIYVSTANSLPVIRALDTLGLSQKIKVIGTDFFPAMAPLVESGKVTASIYQRPREQGWTAVRTIVQYLLDGTAPPPHIYLNPAVVMKSNLDLFLYANSQVSGDEDAQPAGVHPSI